MVCLTFLSTSRQDNPAACVRNSPSACAGFLPVAEPDEITEGNKQEKNQAKDQYDEKSRLDRRKAVHPNLLITHALSAA